MEFNSVFKGLITFHVLWGKSAPREESKEGFGTHAPSHKTVCWWENAIKNGRQIMLQQHSPIIGDRWMPRGTREICPWNYAQYFVHSNCYRCRSISRKCSPYPHQQPGGMKSLCKVDSTQAQQWQKSHACYSCQHPSAALKKWRQSTPWSHFSGWWVIDAVIWLSAETKECWIQCPNVTEKENCMVQIVFWQSCMS